MKEYEKLAKEYGSGMFAQSFSVNPIACGYEAGFLKAREMALEIVREYLDSSPSLEDRIENLGEKEV